MKLLKKLTVALLIACSFMLVMPVVSPLFTESYTVNAASTSSKPKMKVKVTTAKQSGKYYIVKGKVYNKTNKNLSSASVEIELQDKNKKTITTTTNYVCWMDKKGTWKFSTKIYVGDKKVKKYKVSANGTYFKKSTYSKLTTKVSSVKKKKTYSSGYTSYTVKGSIKNKTGVTLKSIYATYAFYDKSGNLLSTRFCGYYSGSEGKLGKNGLKKNKKINVKENSHLIDSSLKVKKCKIIEAHGYRF